MKVSNTKEEFCAVLPTDIYLKQSDPPEVGFIPAFRRMAA